MKFILDDDDVDFRSRRPRELNVSDSAFTKYLLKEMKKADKKKEEDKKKGDQNKGWFTSLSKGELACLMTLMALPIAMITTTVALMALTAWMHFLQTIVR